MCQIGSNKPLPVFGWEGHYEICIQCQSVYSITKNGVKKRIKEQLRNGYFEIYLERTIAGKKKRRHHTLNRLIRMSIDRINPADKDAHHDNKIRTDNRPANLKWLKKELNRGCRWYKRHCDTLDMFKLADYLEEISQKQESDPF